MALLVLTCFQAFVPYLMHPELSWQTFHGNVALEDAVLKVSEPTEAFKA